MPRQAMCSSRCAYSARLFTGEVNMKIKKQNDERLRLAMDNARKLPELCYVVVPHSHPPQIGIVRRGEIGYYDADIATGSLEPECFAGDLNERLGVSKAQASAMLTGSMFGWHIPAADPDNYGADGKLMRPKG
jgi:hypothetical protein